MKHNLPIRTALAMILLVGLLVSFSACAMGRNPDYTQITSNTEGWVGEDQTLDFLSEEINETTADTEPSFGVGAPAGRKIIRNASVEAETENTGETYQILLDWVTQKNGYELEHSVYLNLSQNRIDATVRLPAEHLDEFLQKVGNTATITQKSTYSDDITSSYTDTELRAKSMRASLDAYYRLLNEAKTVAEIVSVQRAIDEITLQIESHEALLNQWNEQLEFSEVNLTLSEPNPYQWLWDYGGILWFIILVVMGAGLFFLGKRTQKQYDRMEQARKGMMPASQWYPLGAQTQPLPQTQPDAQPQSGEHNER